MTPDVPSNPSLESDRKRAKTLLRRCRSGDAEAVSVLIKYHPRFKGAHRDTVIDQAKLADAQLAVARSYGYPSWPSWKQYVETRRMDLAGQAVAMVKAACSNDVRRARVLLEADPALAGFDLWSACVTGEVDVVRRELGRDPAAASRRGGALAWTPLEYACFSRLIRAEPARAAGIEAVVGVLLDAGADPNAYHEHTWEGDAYRETPLFGAAGIANHAGITERLLAAGADPDEGYGEPNPRDPERSPWGIESLYHASEFTDPDSLRLLLAAEPHPVRISYCLGRVLDFADCETRVRAYLSAGADPDFVVPWFAKGTRHFHKAVMLGRSPAVIQAMIAAGADVNTPNGEGVSPLEEALLHGHDALADILRRHGASEPQAAAVNPVDRPDVMCWATARNDIALVERLLDQGADIEGQSSINDGPALHWAAWRGRSEMVRLLVERGADIYYEGRYGAAALGMAIHGSAHCVDPEAGSTMHRYLPAEHGDYPAIVQLLIERGATLPKSIWGGSDAVQDVLRQHGVPDPSSSPA